MGVEREKKPEAAQDSKHNVNCKGFGHWPTVNTSSWHSFSTLKRQKDLQTKTHIFVTKIYLSTTETPQKNYVCSPTGTQCCTVRIHGTRSPGTDGLGCHRSEKPLIQENMNAKWTLPGYL